MDASKAERIEDKVNNHVANVEHVESTSKIQTSDKSLTGFESEESILPKGYFRSSFFLGSMLAIGLNLMGGVGGFALAAPLLTVINADIGPNLNITWVPLVFPLCLSVGLALVGRLTDLFGRRWFLIGGQVLGLVGAAVCATAKNVPTLIGGTTIVGVAASTSLSFSFLASELVPMKYRFIAVAYLYLWVIPFSGLAPAIGNLLVIHTAAGWRWCYYLMMIIDGMAGLAYFFFYHPPTFHMKHGRHSRMEVLKNFDFVGTFLFTSGMVVFLLGISWGGSVYPWKSAGPIASIILGFLTLLAFFLWEVYAPLKEPLVPMHLFKNTGWVISVLLLSIGASVYYGFSIVWPQMAAVLYADGDSTYAGWMSCAVPGGITLGQIVGGALAKIIGKTRYQILVVTAVGGALLAGVAGASPDSKNLPLALLVVGCVLIGWMESLTQTLSGICVYDQREIGVAVGIAGSIRSAVSSVATTIYSAVLSNRLAQTIPAIISPAAISAGLPADSVASLLKAFALRTSSAFDTVNGLTPEILDIVTSAYKEANIKAYQTVFFTSIAFSGVAIILACFAPNVDSLMTGQVATLLHTKDKGGNDTVVDKMQEG
ncbi:hypothetical protein B7463_g3049, partial [Scytalidium lignicola]